MTSNYPDVSERFEHVFTQWQLIMMVSEVKVNIPGNAEGLTPQALRACTQWDKFPEHVLDNTKDFDPRDWVAPGYLNDHLLEMYISLPMELQHWTRSSRRVFSIPRELQAVFGAAEFPDMQWKDILWPHDCFALSLESPLRFVDHSGEKQEYDTILILNSSEGVLVRVFDKPNQNGVSIKVSQNEVRNFRRKIADWKHEDALELVKKKQKRLARVYPLYYPGSTYSMFQHIGGKESPVQIEPADIYYSEQARKMQVGRINLQDWVGQVQQGQSVVPWEQVAAEARYGYEVLSVATRIAVSWMLYLESLPDSALQQRPHRKKRSTLRKDGPAGTITQPERLFEIAGRGSICSSHQSKEEGARNTKGFVRPHWRRAHYKRPRGALPGAAKTVRVPAVLVRADLVPLYGVIGGTTTVMIPKK